jgi:PIN domain nuclease of toxin-antitoxin system
MKLLLDTHAVLWTVGESKRLGAAARRLIDDEAHDRLLSSVVPWEMSIKHRSGKLPQAASALADFAAVVSALRAEVMPIEHHHGLLAGNLDWSHKDPFDRMLAAQALLEGAVLISRDVVFDTLPGLRRIW